MNKLLLYLQDKYLIFWLVLLGMIVSCNKIEYSGKNPYAGAKPPLTLKVDNRSVLPESGTVGTVVSLLGKGFSKYKDSQMVVKFNGIPGKIIEVDDSLLKAEVPKLASSGMITVTVLHQIFAGPVFKVEGPVSIDGDFRSMPGANGDISCIRFVPGGKYIIGGTFTDYGNSGLADGYHGLARINQDGTLDNTFKIGKGVQGAVNSIIINNQGKYIVGGSINNYDERFKSGVISNILRLNSDGSIDSVVIENQRGFQDTLPSLNAYFDGAITKLLQIPFNGKIVVIGDFNYFMKKDFSLSTLDGQRDSVAIDSIRIEGICRLNEDGTFDSSFNFNYSTGEGYPHPNGRIRDAVVLGDGRVVIVGDFTKYHGQPAIRVARIDSSGSLDPSFNNAGGPDDRVFSISLLKNSNYLIGGQFDKIDGKESHKVAVLNSDGSLNANFDIGKGPDAGPDGIVLKAGQLKNDKFFIAGIFNRFSGIKRNGTVILNTDGSVSESFNNLGAMEPSGVVNDFINVPNQNTSVLVGGFTKFDFEPVNRIVSLKY